MAVEELDVTASASTLAATATLVSGSASSDGTARHESLGARQGMVIGRYIVLSELGAGGMGVVLAAYDPQLDRKVALKLLAPRSAASAGARARLQREAQALAKLDNPNVVGVHDVGEHGEQLFVAMDFVAGKTLGAWMAEVSRPRPWRAVLRVFADAGRGLEAAHRAGLVHRDFKPDNVMLGDDGRVRVMDFGLARADFELDECGDGSDREYSRLDQLTRTGTIMGTPAYMPLEQFEARETDARSDQFSFCVSLYQALYGERPFPGGTLTQLQDALDREQVIPAPRDANVPTWLRKAVIRGLAKDPAQRWPSMQALLDALADDPTLRRRKWFAAAGLLTLLGGATWAVVATEQREAQVCHTAEEKLAGAWDDTRRAALQQAMLGTQLSYAADTWERVERHLDDYAAAWVAARTEACEATHAGEQSSELMDLRMACLDERLLSLRETVEELASADATTMKNAVQAVLGLPSLDRCADTDALLAEVPPPEDPELAARVQRLDERLLEARAKQLAGRYSAGLAIVDEVVIEAEQLDYEPLRARAWLRQGELQKDAGEYPRAEATLERAFAATIAQRMWTEALSASVNLLDLAGSQLARYEEARWWAKYAEPLSRAVGTVDGRADYLTALGSMLSDEGKLEEAQGHLEQALAIRESEPNPDSWSLTWTLRGLGMVAAQQGRFDHAYGYFERAARLIEDILGPQHPAVALALANLALAETWRGDWVAGQKLNERVLVILEQTLGPEHPDLAVLLFNLGGIAMELNQLQESKAYYQRSLALNEKHFGRNHPDTAATLLSLGLTAGLLKEHEDAQAYFEQALAAYEASAPGHVEIAKVYGAMGSLAVDQHDFARARTYQQHALEIHERTFGPEHLEVAHSLDNLAAIAYEAAEYEDARSYYDRALPMYERTLGADHPEVADKVCRGSRILAATGDTSEAITKVERALQGIDAGSPQVIAMCRFALANLLWDAPDGQGRDRARARDLALLARDYHGEAGEPMIDEWLRAHGL